MKVSLIGLHKYSRTRYIQIAYLLKARKQKMTLTQKRGGFRLNCELFSLLFVDCKVLRGLLTVEEVGQSDRHGTRQVQK